MPHRGISIHRAAQFWGSRLSNPLRGNTGTFISYDAEPFLPDILAHNNSPSAYPPSRTTGYSPFNLYYAWLLEADDDDFHAAIRQSAARLHDVAVAEGQLIDDAPLYPNYAIFDTPLEKMYANNIPTLRALKKLHDPDDVMGLAGGIKF